MDENDAHMNALVEEAEDRLKEGVATDIEDAVFQLEDEGLTGGDMFSTALRTTLRTKGWRWGPEV